MQHFYRLAVLFLLSTIVLLPNKSYSSVFQFKKLINEVDGKPLQIIRKVIQGKTGMIWVATGENGLFKFNGYSFSQVKLFNNSKPIEIITMHIDKKNMIWIGTKKNGLIRYNEKTGNIHQYLKTSHIPISSNYVSSIISSGSDLWLGTDNGLVSITDSMEVTNFPLRYDGKNLPNTPINAIQIVDGILLVGTQKGLFSFNLKSNEFINLKLNKTLDIRVNDIHLDNDGNIWVATIDGVYKYSSLSQSYVNVFPTILKGVIFSIASDNNYIWFGTLYSGLYSLNKSDNSIINHSYDSKSNISLSDNSILSLSIDQSNVLWVGTFNDGVNTLDLNALNFGLENDTKNSISCSSNNIFYGVYQDVDNITWISSQNGLIKFNSRTNACSLIGSDLEKTNSFTHPSIYTISPYDENRFFVPTIRGLNLYNNITHKISQLKDETPRIRTYFVTKYQEDSFLLGTDYGLYKYNPKTKSSIKIITNSVDGYEISAFVVLSSGKYLFSGSSGLYHFNEYEELEIYKIVQDYLPNAEIQTIFLENNNLWIGTEKHGVYQFGPTMGLINNEHIEISKGTTINSIEQDNNKNMWFGTDNGLIKLDTTNHSIHVFNKSDGLQSNYFLKSSSFKANDGKLYFGGRNGYNAFYPDDIKLNVTPPKIALTEFTRFGQLVEAGEEKDGFLLKQDINQLNELILSYKDYVIGFEFAALDYADPSRNKYAYMMEGLDPNWIYVDANNRNISYSNLKAGEYTFKVKGSNKDGVWNEEGKSLRVIVKPAPWFSWWAYVLYLVILYCFISWYFKKKNAENQRLTDLLKYEVAQQTQELQAQKQTVEKLLMRKNELFANVSHEFRTPLTLILGPINKLLNSHLPLADINALKMINRNANRLLTMIEQLLQLAKVTDDKNRKHYPIKTAIHIETIVESFRPLAEDKRIDLQLLNNKETAISTSKDALEIIIGNLLSNAIKYTQRGGKVTVNSTVIDNKITIEVSDTGCGLDEQQQKDIFNRFKRLDSHQNIEGIGIGLSVVEDIININKAELKIRSKPGEGSTFSVSFTIIAMDFEEVQPKAENLLIKQLASERTEINEPQDIQQTTNSKQKESILIIDDNHDMRLHIANSIKDYYHCYLADGGKTGIALALKHVPDIIICDVMMPEMDGFHVSRVLRSDTRTSHIPLILLTALDDRESRIRGWREHVDVYLTKPFDAQELLLQLENILVIRNILKQKAGQKIKAGMNSNNLDLPKCDQQFIDKLNLLISKKYQNPNYLRPQIASDMAVSERQLQRKLKALIDKNPMDLLREYRLSQAAIMLKDGYQVSITSDKCGFNSLPHFSKCFKSQYGLSPKAYQQSCNDK